MEVPVVELALHELSGSELVTDWRGSPQMTRRSILRTFGLAAAAVPVLLTLQASPVFAAACPGTCAQNNDCNVTGCGTRTKCCTTSTGGDPKLLTCVNTNGNVNTACS
jgi:hypothetical protein